MSPAEGSLVIRNALVFDGMSEELVPGDIRIDAGRIVEIGAVASQDCPSLDAAGSVVTPGLIDGHFHAYGISLNMLEMEGSRTSYVALQGATRLTRALKRGFTTVRDAAGGDIGLARALDEGLVSGPSYLFAGPALSQTGGHGDGRQAHLDVSAGSCHSVEVVDGVDRLRVAVRERLRTGASLIKIMASGGVVSPSDPIRVPQYSAEEIRAVTDEATRRGSYVAAHAYSPEAIRHAVTNGVRSIEHGNLLDDSTARLMAEHGAVLVPTLVTYQAMAERGKVLGMTPIGLEKNAQVLEAGKAAIECATGANVLVGFGTDLMGSLESEQLRGLEVQHSVQGTLELLRSVTGRNAAILGDDRFGRIALGAAGDVLILGGNPFSNPEVLWQSAPGRRVVKAGVVVA
jgi:imidazolonepropionase-like amidohydrolase